MAKKVNEKQLGEEVIIRPPHINQEKLFNDISEYIDKEKELSKLTEEVNEYKDTLKTIGIDEFKRIYDIKRKNPATITIEAVKSDKTASFMLVSKAQYGYKGNFTDIPTILIEESTKFEADTKLVEQYYDVLVEMIKKSDVISDLHKNAIFKKTKTVSLKKDSISNLNIETDTLTENVDTKYKPSDLLDIIKPVYSVMNFNLD